MAAREFNFDGLVGPTHNYAGLAYGNVASATHRNQVSNPRAAALQGLEKMKKVASLGIGQAVLPPLPRPRISFLRELGYSGSRQSIIESVAKSDPVLLASIYSSSNMWTANAATVSPSADCEDGRLHITVANLASSLHRSIEAAGTYQVLKSIFANEECFRVHPALPPSMTLMDEGAANHTRLCSDFGKPGIENFVYGRVALNTESAAPKKFPARQTLEATQAIIRRHGLNDERTVVLQQNPDSIDAGVFHNDVISVGNQNVLLCHELSFVNQSELLEQTRRVFESQCSDELHICELKQSDISMEDCVSSYLFNSQILTRPDGKMTLICPTESSETESAKRCTEKIVTEVDPIDEVIFLDLRQSMNNGGGPACLRLRVVLDDQQLRAVHPNILFDENLYERLKTWIETHYREELHVKDLADPKLAIEMDACMVALSDILQLPLFELAKLDR